MGEIRNNALIVFDEHSCCKDEYEAYFEDIFPLGKTFVYLGEIPNAKGHCIIGDLGDGRLLGAYHIENFREATDDEV